MGRWPGLAADGLAPIPGSFTPSKKTVRHQVALCKLGIVPDDVFDLRRS